MKTLFISLFISVFAMNVFAEIPEESKNSESAKLVKMVKEADVNDWETYTKAALYSINWNADLELAKEWIDHAIALDKNHKTLEVLGDYYLRIGEHSQALNLYMKALEINVTEIDKIAKDRLQRKIKVYAKILK
ncbi:tetratricopeptide repeat protein [Flammeovirga agarivorans]|uniref:Tetratricopeptide repeat protein n=1 Tax=Flammeovirga agarivorans TaxID=2726742 RepID=A0A7X8XYJ0_9BACT|nr:tetratricopeptide repeat protein [Flammeovirga agarivorans]NLR94276.1 hypothetical protein [Flammeovirga agarivorans]